VVLDRVVLSVDGQALSYSELEFEARILSLSHATPQDDLSDLLTAPLELNLLQALLPEVEGRVLALHEAEKLLPPDDARTTAEVSRAIDRLAEKVGGKARLALALTRNDFSEADLRRVLRRELRVNQYLDSQVQLEARVNDSLVDDYLAAHRDEFPGEASQETRDGVRQALVSARSEKLRLAQLRRLRARARVRIVDERFRNADAVLTGVDAAE
jgi:hypothetical protein